MTIFSSYRLCLVILLLGTNLLVQGEAVDSINSRVQLCRGLEEHVSSPRFSGAIWGISVVSLDSGETVFEHHPDRLMSPASNSKLYTGALALDRLGADYRIKTPICFTGTRDNAGTIRGDLVISGRGDPSWNTAHAGNSFSRIFQPIITLLTNSGVHHITGDLVGDTTFFHSPPVGAGWSTDDLDDAEGAEISALTLNENVTQIHIKVATKVGEPCALSIGDPLTGLILDNQSVTITKDKVGHIETRRFRGENVVHVIGTLPLESPSVAIDMPVLRPAEWFVAALKEEMKKHGIVVDGKSRCVSWPSAPVVATNKLGEVVSPALSEMIRDFMKPSQNLETDLIFAHTGETTRSATTPTWQTSEQCALSALEKFFLSNELPARDVRFDEGSGLSRNNLTTANATVALLELMPHHASAKAYLESLPIAGVDGTLRHRMVGTAAAGNVRAKTGTLRWANDLSGFLTTAGGEHLVFSIMLNRYVATAGHSGRDEIDALVIMLANFKGLIEDAKGTASLNHQNLGKLILKPFATAPFPHPLRAEGYKYHEKAYSALEHYSDNTVALFIPEKFRETKKLDFVVHFHGWNNTVEGTLQKYRLLEQFAASGRNAILVVPEGPHNAPDSFGGKLEDTNGFVRFMDEVLEKVRANAGFTNAQPVIGKVILSGHSGGYHVMASILDHGGLSKNIQEVWLFDALYAGTRQFMAWQRETGGRFLNIFTDHGGTKSESETLIEELKSGDAKFYLGEDIKTSPEDIQNHRLVFLTTDMAHDEVIMKRFHFRQFLETSALEKK